MNSNQTYSEASVLLIQAHNFLTSILEEPADIDCYVGKEDVQDFLDYLNKNYEFYMSSGHATLLDFSQFQEDEEFTSVVENWVVKSGFRLKDYEEEYQALGFLKTLVQEKLNLEQARDFLNNVSEFVPIQYQLNADFNEEVNNWIELNYLTFKPNEKHQIFCDEFGNEYHAGINWEAYPTEDWKFLGVSSDLTEEELEKARKEKQLSIIEIIDSDGDNKAYFCKEEDN